MSENYEAESTELSAENAELLREFAASLTSIDLTPSENENRNEPQIGLYQLFESLTSQRHELKLHTKSGRQTQELLQQNIEMISEAVEALKRYKKERPEVERKSVAPYLMSLINIDESLQRAANALDSLQEQLNTEIRNGIASMQLTYFDEMSWWERFRKRKIIRAFAEYLKRNQCADIERILSPFRQGFEMLQFRMDDVLSKHSIRRLNPVGEPVDPETMRVVAVVESQSVLPGHVADVVRYGYLWRNKPLRFADVQAAR